MTIEIKGTVKEIFGTLVVTEKFSKKELVVTIDETTKYPQHILIQANNDKISLLDNIKKGDLVTTRVNLNGREANDKYYNSFSIYTLQKN